MQWIPTYGDVRLSLLCPTHSHDLFSSSIQQTQSHSINLSFSNHKQCLVENLEEKPLLARALNPDQPKLVSHSLSVVFTVFSARATMLNELVQELLVCTLTHIFAFLDG